ncbi:hypothetical protein LIER_16515 [Lithospermum erythrorhizon]|uniref:BZIP domain-containing protein n=1 Tax=Lithospermum erythrorhizon TaxID=34254 RepID=A0AAV3Q8C2_LITER
MEERKTWHVQRTLKEKQEQLDALQQGVIKTRGNMFNSGQVHSNQLEQDAVDQLTAEFTREEIKRCLFTMNGSKAWHYSFSITANFSRSSISHLLRWIANRLSAQRSRKRKLEYKAELEAKAKCLQICFLILALNKSGICSLSIQKGLSSHLYIIT